MPRKSIVTTIILALLIAAPVPLLAAGAEANIPIVVDGQPLDARAVLIGDEVYIPAWILGNYAHTKVNWMRQGNLLEILVNPSDASSAPPEATIKIKVGYYFGGEGFVVGKSTRLYLLNVDPKDFRFPDGKTPGDRAHEGALERLGPISDGAKAYLTLPPIDRFTPKGWGSVSKMPKDEIAGLPLTVEKYEGLYKALFYDLVTNLVIAKSDLLRGTMIDESLKGVRIDVITVDETGTGTLKVPGAGLNFIYGRSLYKNNQIVWDIPIAVRGGENVVELSNRNAALMQ